MPRVSCLVAVFALGLASKSTSGQSGPLNLQRLATASANVALMVGEVTDAVSDGRRVVIASEREGRLVVLSPSLSVRSRVGRRGSGPGEFRELRAVRLAPDGSVLALDRALRRISRFTWVGDSLRLTQTIGLSVDPYDLLALDDGSVWVLGPYAGSRLHRIAADGRVIESRWPLASNGPTAVVEQLAQDGWLARDRNDLIVASPYSPATISVPERDGAPIRLDSLPGFYATIVEPYRNGVTVRSGPEGASSPIRPFRLPGEQWLAQATVIARQDGGDERPMQWRRSSKSSRWIGPQRVDYRAFALGNGEVLVQFEDDAGTLVRGKLVERTGSSAISR